jgi:hypothetical protein
MQAGTLGESLLGQTALRAERSYSAAKGTKERFSHPYRKGQCRLYVYRL